MLIPAADRVHASIQQGEIAVVLPIVVPAGGQGARKRVPRIASSKVQRVLGCVRNPVARYLDGDTGLQLDAICEQVA